MAHQPVGERAIAIVLRVFRLELDRLDEFLDRFVVFLFLRVLHSAVGMAARVAGDGALAAAARLRGGRRGEQAGDRDDQDEVKDGEQFHDGNGGERLGSGLKISSVFGIALPQIKGSQRRLIVADCSTNDRRDRRDQL